jgi:hypothetical protein
MNNVDIEKKRKFVINFAKVGGLCLAGFFVSPFIYVAIGGLIGMVIAYSIGAGIIFFTPVIASFLGTLRIKMLKADAAKNPVETLQKDYMRRQQALSNFETAISNFIAEKESFAEKLDGFKIQYPAEAPKFALQLSKMNQLLAVRKQKYQDAKHSLELYDAEIHKASAIWDMGQAAAQMTKAAGMSDADFFAKIQVETALDSVQKNMNTAFADLEVSLMTEKSGPPDAVVADAPAQAQLPPARPADSFIDVETTDQPAAIRVSHKNK